MLGYVNGHTSAKAYRPTRSSEFSDMLVEYAGLTSWIEIKMTTHCNLLNSRAQFDKSWTCASSILSRALNSSEQAQDFIQELRTFSTQEPVLSYDGTGLDVMSAFVKERNRQYVHEEEKVKIRDVVEEHYLSGKRRSVHYIQIGDNFYSISSLDPLGLNVPVFDPIGHIKIRLALRSKRYEILAEVKCTDIEESEYSLYPFTEKKCPFINIV